MRHEVTEADSAIALGSGDVPVLATPRLIAWMEARTVQEAQPLLGEDQTSVGTAIRIEHLRATPIGGEVERAVVDRDRFLAGLSAAHTAADAGPGPDASH